MSDVAVPVPLNQQTSDKTRLKPKTIDKLPPEQRQWAANVLKALGLQPRSSQNRIFAGAISSATLVEQNSQSVPERTKAKELRELVQKAGTDPWDGATAMKVGAAKMHLDILTIPPKDRAFRLLPSDEQGVNKSMWIDRIDADGVKRPSFLCKPASPNTGGEMGPSGGPKGGEVAREALVGRAASWLDGALGIDVGMPETQVVKLDGSLTGGTPGQSRTCSVQEARNVTGDLRGATPETRRQLDREQIAAMAVFDTMTLNVDRHSGNFMLDPDNKLVPIDHGESFIEPNDEGLDRLQAAMGGPHNALLSLPGAHEPLSKDMIKKLKSIDPKSYAKSLSGDNASIGKEHIDMQGAISDGAIDIARRAARFTQLAAKAEPAMSPAAIQVAMGNAAHLLFAPTVDETQFEVAARTVIDRFAGQGEVLKQVCTGSDPEWDKLSEKAAALGWKVALRSGVPSAEVISDPLTLLKIIKGQTKAPVRLDAQRAMMLQLAQSPALSPDEAIDVVVKNKLDAIDGAIRLAALNDQRGLAGQKSQALRSTSGDLLPSKEQIPRLDGLLKLAVSRATQELTRQLDLLQVTGQIDAVKLTGLLSYNLTAYDEARGYLQRSRPEPAKPHLDIVDGHVNSGKYIDDAANSAAIFLNRTADSMRVPSTDDDLQQGLQAAAQRDPVLANKKLERLKRRARGLLVVQKGVAAMQAELNDLRQKFVIDPTNPLLVAAESAIQDGDLDLAYTNLEKVTNNVLDAGTPSAARMTQLAQTLQVPNNDVDLVAALQAANANNAQLAAQSWRRVVTRATAGAFGTQGVDACTQRLTQLLQVWVIPAKHASLRAAQGAIAANKATEAIHHLDRLDGLAAADMFARV